MVLFFDEQRPYLNVWRDGFSWRKRNVPMQLDESGRGVLVRWLHYDGPLNAKNGLRVITN